MAEIDIPLVHRSAEALAALFDHNDARARNSVRLLTFSELLYLAVAADQLAALARAVRHETWPNPGPRLKGMVAEVGEHARDESSGTDRPWPICWAQHQGMLCDRKQGHDGDHVDIYGPLTGHAWPRAAEQPEPARGGTVATQLAALPPVLLPDPDASRNVCPKSQRVDGPYHSTRWDGDDARTVCVFCGEVRDALSGAIIRQGDGGAR